MFQTVTKTSWQCRVGGGWCPQLPRAVLAQMTRGAATHLLLLAVTDQNVNIRRGAEQRTQLVPQNGWFCDSDMFVLCRQPVDTEREQFPFTKFDWTLYWPNGFQWGLRIITRAMDSAVLTVKCRGEERTCKGLIYFVGYHLATKWSLTHKPHDNYTF